MVGVGGGSGSGEGSEVAGRRCGGQWAALAVAFAAVVVVLVLMVLVRGLLARARLNYPSRCRLMWTA